jgi:hypothetical protein
MIEERIGVQEVGVPDESDRAELAAYYETSSDRGEPK